MDVRDGRDPAAVQQAAAHLRAGRLVVFPTETVYGLGADAADDDAVRSIFAAKGRPADNPVIVHCRDIAHAQAVSGPWPKGALELAKRFWPGPLTLVVPRSRATAPTCSAGLDTVALRVPAHPVAQALLHASGLAIAAPSANRSGLPSPTRVADAVADLGERAALYLDGGPCDVGLESTVVGWPGGKLTLLRQGGVPAEQIAAVAGPLANAAPGAAPLAPGMKYRHYAPETPLRLVASGALRALWDQERRRATRTAWLVSTESGLRGDGVTVVASRHDPKAWAHRLFAALRDADVGYDAIVVEAIPEDGLGAAVMERLRKAATR